jgi:hypothetical protein
MHEEHVIIWNLPHRVLTMPVKINKLPSLEILNHHLSYDSNTGLFFAKTGGRAGWKVGNEVGTQDRGYIRIRIDKKYYPAHRIAWAMTHGYYNENQQIDHIDGIRSNNKISNLRLATHGQNCQNIGIPKHNTSGIKGVHWDNANKRWKAQIRINGIRKYIGYFSNKEEAHAAYCKAAKELHGDFSKD